MFTTLAPIALPVHVGPERALALAKENGFDAVDLPLVFLRRPVPSDADRLREMYESSGVRPGGWVLPFPHHLSDAEFHRGLRGLPALAELAGSLGSLWGYTWLPPYSDELEASENLARTVVRLRAVADVLGDYGVRLGLEVIGPKTLRTPHRYSFIHTIPQALELLDQIDRPHVGLMLDCYHWYTAHGTIEDLQQVSGSQIVYVHINDAPAGVPVDEQQDLVRELPGATGVIDVASFLRVLANARPDAPIAVEPYNARVARLPVERRVRVAAESLRRTLDAAGLSELQSSSETSVRPSANAIGASSV